MRTTLVSLAVFGALLAGAASASAADFTMKFDSAVIQTGWRYQTPGANNHNDVPVEPEDVVVFNGSNNNGAITIPSDGVKIKDEVVTIEPFASHFAIEWRATTPFTGVFNPETGQLDLSGTLEQTVRQGTNVCTTGPVNVDLSTETNQLANGHGGNNGVRFVDGLEGPGALTAIEKNGLRKTSGVNCDRDNLNCYARTSIAGTSFSAAFATSGRLIRGVSSIEICDPPGVATPDPWIRRLDSGIVKVPKPSRSKQSLPKLALAQVSCSWKPCRITSARSVVKVRGKRYKSEVRVKRGRLEPNEVAKAVLVFGQHTRKRLIKGVKSGSARIKFKVRSDDDSVGVVKKTIRFGLTR